LVSERGAYANLALGDVLAQRGISGLDAAFATELTYGAARMAGTYDAIADAAGRRDDYDPAVRDLLRLGCHQLLAMRVPRHAAVDATVELARRAVGPKITGLVNAVLRRVAVADYDGWIALLGKDRNDLDVVALRTAHPRWIVDAYAELFPGSELEEALAANNVPAATMLVARPGLATLDELIEAGAEPSRWSPVAAAWNGDPGTLRAVAEGRAGVQDEGSQLVALTLASLAGDGPWLDVCAGPGGKAALLAGLADAQGIGLLAGERRPHRAGLVRTALAGYARAAVVVADATRPAWAASSAGLVLADVPCTGLGALRRRPEARWRKKPSDLADLVPTQRSLLHAALDSCAPGGMVGYVTCSPHQAETVDVVESVLAERTDVAALDAPAALDAVLAVYGRLPVPDAARVSDAGHRYVQLWPHRHGTDAMFLAALRRR